MSYYTKRKMKTRIKLLAYLTATTFLAPLISYISGRIVLPEMGLTAPSYGIWFASFLVLLIGYIAYYTLKELLGFSDS